MAQDTPDQLEQAAADIAGGVATKADLGKPRWSLMPMSSLARVANIFTFGANKYSAHNWRTGGGMAYSRCTDAMLRHIAAFSDGEDIDPDSGEHHLASVAFYCLTLMWYGDHGSGQDDRFRPGLQGLTLRLDDRAKRTTAERLGSQLDEFS